MAYVGTFDKTNYNLGDYYLVLRNDNGSVIGDLKEATFQFMATEIMPLRTRVVPTS